MVVRVSRTIVTLLFLGLVEAMLGASGSALAEETPHEEVVHEFIRQIGEAKDGQDIATRDIAEATDLYSKMAAIIRNSARSKFLLETYVRYLKAMTISGPTAFAVTDTVALYEKKIALLDEQIKSGEAMLVTTPQAGVDYVAMSTRILELGAQIGLIEESLFRLTPAYFALLIDQRPDAKNHLSRLNITRAEKKKLLDSISVYFPKLTDKDRNWAASSAWVLQYYLTKKGYKCSDEE